MAGKQHISVVFLGAARSGRSSLFGHLIFLLGGVAERVIRLSTNLGFQFDALAEVDRNTLLAGLEEFRQHLGGRLTVTMLDGIGAPIDVHEIDRTSMMMAIEKVSAIAAAAKANRP